MARKTGFAMGTNRILQVAKVHEFSKGDDAVRREYWEREEEVGIVGGNH